MTATPYRLFTGISQLLTMPRLRPGQLANAPAQSALGLIEDAAILVDMESGTIIEAGQYSRLQNTVPGRVEIVDLGGAVVLPGLVDCHTHLVYAGDRSRDYESRCSGASYQEIGASGGGIRLTVQATRRATVEELTNLATPRLKEMLSRGVTTLEIKSGYGLNVVDELKQLQASAILNRTGPQDIVATCLAAHIVPDEYVDRRQEYVALVCTQILPRAAELASFVDVFCEEGAFNLAETETILRTAANLGMGLKIHGEQLTHTGAGALAARMRVTSLDHAEHLSTTDIPALARAGTVAVLLPGASVFLGDPVKPPARALIEGGVEVAIATDCNPGSSPTTDLWLMGTLACSWYGLRPHEALRAMTTAGATALNLYDRGTITESARADFAVCQVPDYRHLLYHMGHNPVSETWIRGSMVWKR